jgi:hypothetical protein
MTVTLQSNSYSEVIRIHATSTKKFHNRQSVLKSVEEDLMFILPRTIDKQEKHMKLGDCTDVKSSNK